MSRKLSSETLIEVIQREVMKKSEFQYQQEIYVKKRFGQIRTIRCTLQKTQPILPMLFSLNDFLKSKKLSGEILGTKIQSVVL